MSTPITTSAGNSHATQLAVGVSETTSTQTNTNNNNGQQRAHGFAYRAFVHGRINNNLGPRTAIVASIIMYLGLAFLGHAAAVLAQAYTAGVAFESALLLTATPVSIALGTAVAIGFIIYFGNRNIEVPVDEALNGSNETNDCSAAPTTSTAAPITSIAAPTTTPVAPTNRTSSLQDLLNEVIQAHAERQARLNSETPSTADVQQQQQV